MSCVSVSVENAGTYFTICVGTSRTVEPGEHGQVDGRLLQRPGLQDAQHVVGVLVLGQLVLPGLEPLAPLALSHA